ncbi:MAG: GNAT family N-acetyltransferase [Alphaproteobacteria bacterium]|nr:GNAT family N-acetyltransferase [Alphaproteobacteria bacterium]
MGELNPLSQHQNHSTAQAVLQHLWSCDGDFVPPLSTRLNLSDYSQKICAHAERFEYCTAEPPSLVALVAAYFNRETGIGFVTNVSVLPNYRRHGLARHLMERVVAEARARGMNGLRLEAAAGDEATLRFYQRLDFVVLDLTGVGSSQPQFLTLELRL